MKLSLFASLMLVFLTSCKGQASSDSTITIDAIKVKAVTIYNKMYCSVQPLKHNKIVITDQKTIEEIINTFSQSQVIKEYVSLSAHYGFFEIDFKEAEKSYTYGITYTVYNGVVVSNDNKGYYYRNNRLAGLVHGLFTK